MVKSTIPIAKKIFIHQCLRQPITHCPPCLHQLTRALALGELNHNADIVSVLDPPINLFPMFQIPIVQPTYDAPEESQWPLVDT